MPKFKKKGMKKTLSGGGECAKNYKKEKNLKGGSNPRDR